MAAAVPVAPQWPWEWTFSLGLVLGAVNNLIDNSLYWRGVRWPDGDADGAILKRRLFIGGSDDLVDGPAILVADNGVGFQGDAPGRT